MKKILLACLLCMGIMVGCGGAKNETYDITVNDLGKKYSSVADFLSAYSSTLTTAGTDFQTCMSSGGDATQLNKCKKQIADELQKLVDLQGPTDKASQEKAMDDLIVSFNNDVVQSLKTKMNSSDITDLQKKISDWQQKMTAAVVAYQQ